MSIKKSKKIIFSVFSVLVVLAMLISMILSSSAPLLAKESISDNTTTNDYTTHLNHNMSTRYAGRVWTDKSVHNVDVTFKGEVGNDVTINKSENADFLVAYSALATSQAIYGKSTACVDVVFVIDVSGSMRNEMGERSRIEHLVDALNTSIDTFLKTHENSRISVVGFNNSTYEFLPLDHYTKKNDENYFTVEKTRKGAKLKVNAINSSGDSISKVQEVTGGTNTHMGMYTGMNILANAQNTETNGYKHIPALILLSDGAATYSGENSEWWDPSGRTGNGSSTNDSHVLKVAMNAQYMKQKVNKNYGVTDPEAANAMKIYTIGMGIEQLKNEDEEDYYRAQLALNPTHHINDTNTYATNIKDTFDEYKKGNTPKLDEYIFYHPKDDIDTIAYNDGYYSAENANDVSNVFDDITNTIT